MNILVVTQYFWPESFRINDLCIGLREKGHKVTVLTGQPNYPKGNFYQGYSFFSKSKEVWEGITIYRSPLIPRGNSGGIRLLINYFSFALFASLKVLLIRGKFDKIFVYEPSPITVGLPAIVAKNKFDIPIYFWVQDLWPESLSAGGGVKNKLILNIFENLTKYIYNSSKYVLVQSEAFKGYIKKQGIDESKIIYYPNSTESFYRVVDLDESYSRKLPIGFKLMFAGNLGEAQSLDTLLMAAKILKEKSIPVKWVILGEGRMQQHIEQKIIEFDLSNEFCMMGSYPSIEMPQFFSCADALIVSLKKDNIFALTIPSKVQSYLACGKPVIGSLDGEGARIILEANAGFVSEAEDSESLACIVEKLYNMSVNDRKIMGENARSYYESQFERETLLRRLEIILNS